MGRIQEYLAEWQEMRRIYHFIEQNSGMKSENEAREFLKRPLGGLSFMTEGDAAACRNIMKKCWMMRWKQAAGRGGAGRLWRT